jgi:hypothetical protein
MAKDTDQKRTYEELKHKAAENPFLKRYVAMGIKEGLFSDSANALGRMHDTLVDAAWPELIGRSIINVLPTTEALERFPLDGGAIAYQYAEGGAVRLSGKKPTTVDVSTNLLVESGDEWTQEFSEDATWNVLDGMVGNVGRAVGVKETQKMQLHQLLNDDKFVKSVYLPSSQTDIEQGNIGTVLGMKVQVCNEITNGVAYAIDTRVASVMLLRRDLTVEDWYDAKTGKSGIRGSTRFGLGVLRSTAIARMTNIKTTLT